VNIHCKYRQKFKSNKRPVKAVLNDFIGFLYALFNTSFCKHKFFPLRQEIQYVTICIKPLNQNEKARSGLSCTSITFMMRIKKPAQNFEYFGSLPQLRNKINEHDDTLMEELAIISEEEKNETERGPKRIFDRRSALERRAPERSAC
jgi:hypothetical protein